MTELFRLEDQGSGVLKAWIRGVPAYQVQHGTPVHACRSCAAKIAFVPSEKSDRMPVNVTLAVRYKDLAFAPTHFADCPGRNSHSGSARGSGAG